MKHGKEKKILARLASTSLNPEADNSGVNTQETRRGEYHVIINIMSGLGNSSFTQQLAINRLFSL